MGRSSRPVHQHREDHRPPAPGQARRPAGDPHRPGERLPHRRTLMRTPRPGPPRRLRLPRRTARLRLAVLYGAAFLVCSAVVLGVVAYVLFGSGRYQQLGGSSNSTVSEATMTTRIPGADVQQAGSYDIIQQFRVPAADLQRAGSYYVYKVTIPAKALALTPAELANLDARGTFQVHVDERDALIVCALILAGIAVAAAAIGWIIAGRVLRPLSTITAAARRIAASSLHERLALHGPDDELKELGDTLDDLFARLEASFDAQRRFVANASHELRTPLTRERTLLQATLAGPAASRRGLRVHADIQPAVLDGDRVLVQQLVSNLVGNAVRHNVPGGDLHVTTRASDAGAVLAVTNSGQVIPSAEVDRLFQPFQRLGSRPARRDGHGL